MKKTIVQLIKFGIVGLSNTIIAYIINLLVLFVLSPLNLAWDYIVGNVFAFVLSVLWSFFWNNKLVFIVGEGEKRVLWKALLKTYIAYGFTGILLNNVLSYVWIEYFCISKLIAPIINLSISVPINFLINKLWAFRTDKKEE